VVAINGRGETGNQTRFPFPVKGSSAIDAKRPGPAAAIDTPERGEGLRASLAVHGQHGAKILVEQDPELSELTKEPAGCTRTAFLLG
jgi:hypothetical protein